MESLKMSIVSVVVAAVSLSFAFNGIANMPSAPNQPEVLLNKAVHAGASSTANFRVSMFVVMVDVSVPDVFSFIADAFFLPEHI
jgi:hypothetical protein